MIRGPSTAGRPGLNRTLALLCVLALAMPWPQALAQVEGRVRLSVDGRELRSSEARDAVVYFRPEQPVAVAPAAEPLEMRTEGKAFVPRALPVTVGSEVRFPNRDPILHNVFSPPGRQAFDLGVYGADEVRSHRFDAPGLVRVFCNVHHDMVAHVLVLDTPWFAHPDDDGRFHLEVPPGTAGQLYVWHERASLWREPMTAGEAGPVEVRVELNRPRVPRHMNKFGKPYGSNRPRGY